MPDDVSLCSQELARTLGTLKAMQPGSRVRSMVGVGELLMAQAE